MPTGIVGSGSCGPGEVDRSLSGGVERERRGGGSAGHMCVGPRPRWCGPTGSHGGCSADAIMESFIFPGSNNESGGRFLGLGSDPVWSFLCLAPVPSNRAVAQDDPMVGWLAAKVISLGF